MRKIKNGDVTKVKECRICKSKNLTKFLSLGKMPIPNGFLSKSELKKEEKQYPLGVLVCEDCWMVQLTHLVSPSIMFKNYLYIPSTSETMLNHFSSFALETIREYSLKSNDIVIDIGSNDGTLLKYFKEQEVRVLGVDPASNLCQVARLNGIDTVDAFFSEEVAKEVEKEYGKAKVITATNVFAHIDDLHSVCRGIKLLLDKNGVFVVEFPYLTDLLQKNEFDTIYHEHLSYFSIHPLQNLVEQFEMRIVNIKRLPVHGGSLRVYISHKSSSMKTMPVVAQYIKDEKLHRLDKLDTYKEFARRVRTVKRDLLNYLNRLKKQGKRVAAYGAAAKGNVMLNYCGIDTSLIDYVVDSIPYKQGKYTPGTHIPIYPESRLVKDKPDYTLILAWNFADEILKKQTTYRENGGQFIITIPYLRVE